MLIFKRLSAYTSLKQRGFFSVNLYILFILCVSFLLDGCEISSFNQSIPKGNVGNLSYIAPNIVPSIATTIGYGYIAVTNLSNEAVTGISYTLTNTVGGAAKIELDTSRVNWCSSIEAHQSCTLRLVIPAGTAAGSFNVSAKNSNSDAELDNKAIKPVLGSATSGTIGIEQIPLSDTAGVDGVSLYYHNTVIAGSKYIMLTGVVTSDNVGDFNDVILKNERGGTIAGQTIISANLGAGLPNLDQGSIFAILLPAPAVGTTQKITLETILKSADGVLSNLQTGSASNYTLTTSKSAKQAIISALPSMVILTKNNPSQVLTIYNSGTLVANLAGITSNSKNTEVKFDATSVEAGATSTGIISLVSTIGVPVKSDLILDYAESRENLTQKIAVYQDLVPPLKVASSAATQNQGKHSS